MFLLAASLGMWFPGSLGWSAEIDGFTEPYRTVNVAAVETGTIKSISVREGDPVEKGQVLAQLDNELYLALLAIADESMRAQGQLKSAQAELEMRCQRLEKLEELRTQGHARQEEVERARADVAIGDARVLSAKEVLEVKRLEYEKVKVQLERRVIRAPLSGTVNVLYKDEGEFVAPNDPYVLEIVELDPLLATFSVPSYLAVRLQVAQSVPVFLDDASQFVQGTIELISPVTDAESGTVRVKIRIPNAEGKYRSGERCTLQIKNKTTSPQVRRRSGR
jgi:RND family efflux transporter MFP subunit